LRVDLHSHTTASDGSLTPAELCLRAAEQGVQLLAITDHDTVKGYREADSWLRRQGIPLQLLAAVEYSCVWKNLGVHVVGLGIDTEHAATVAANVYFYNARRERAALIAAKLTKLGMPGSLEGALALAGESQIGRPYFARFMVAQGYVRSEDEAFDRFLGAGKPGDIRLLWPELAEVVAWIRAAGGVAVLAHPAKYRLTATRLRRLVADFHACGGEAIEVVVGRQPAATTAFMAQLCRQNELAGSVGSDFHRPGNAWCELGKIDDLPVGCEPVWKRWMN
jgi:predicted metal-dependent phosphoesterase TrpH